MVCPKCGGKIRVTDTFPTENNEIYRHRKCDVCCYSFYTVEFEVEYSEQLGREIYNTPRATKHRNKRKAVSEKQKRLNDLRKQAFDIVCPKCEDCLCDGRDSDCHEIHKWINKQIKKEK